MICHPSVRPEKKTLRSPLRILGEDVAGGLTELNPDKGKIKRNLIHRFDVLSELESGWLYDSGGSYGEVPSRDEWMWLYAHIAEYPPGLPKAFVFPTMKGGIRFEWVFVNHIIEVDIQPSERNAIGRVVSADSLLEMPGKTAVLSLAENWTPLFDFVKREREQ